MTAKSFSTAVKKGEIGERIVRAYMEARGHVVYRPVTEGAHAFDGLAVFQKKQVIAFDVKAKARMNKWPGTGVNVSHFLTYWQFSRDHNIPFYLFFVDEMLGQIYGNELSALEESRVIDGVSYPFVLNTRNDPIRIWPIEAMSKVADLSEEQKAELAACNQRAYSAPDTASMFLQTLNIDEGMAWKTS